MRATKVMTRHVTCITPEAPLRQAWAIMRKLSVRHLPVVIEGRLVGILSDRDLLARGTRADDGVVSMPETFAGEAMTLSPVTCTMEATVSKVARLMLEHRIDSIPVISEGDRLVGLITSTDLIELLTTPEVVSAPLPFEFQLKSANDVLAA